MLNFDPFSLFSPPGFLCEIRVIIVQPTIPLSCVFILSVKNTFFFASMLCPLSPHFLKQVQPGVWFPEEAFEDEARRSRLFDDAIRGAFIWESEEADAEIVLAP